MQLLCLGFWLFDAVLELKCWGNGAWGVLGKGNENDIGLNPNEMGDNLTAVDLGVGFNVTSVICGTHHNCALSLNRGMATNYHLCVMDICE